MYNHTRSYVTAFVCHLLLSLTDTICQSKYNYVLIERNLFELTYQFCESALYEANKIRPSKIFIEFYNSGFIGWGEKARSFGILVTQWVSVNIYSVVFV
jgi:hypothetical protein